MVALVIDDDGLNIEVLVKLLEKEGLETRSVKYPSQLPDLLAEMRDIDVIFLDLEFPNDDGFEILEWMRDQPQLNDVPIVAYSVHTSEIDVARQAGFDSFIGKPINSYRFPALLDRILNYEAVWEI